jgi:hypothetical protein
MMHPLLSLALLIVSYFSAYFSRLYFPTLARIPMLALMAGAFFIEIAVLVFVGSLRSAI